MLPLPGRCRNSWGELFVLNGGEYFSAPVRHVSEERAQPRHSEHREKHKEKFHLRPPNEVSGIAHKIPPRFSFVLFPHADALLAMWERVQVPPRALMLLPMTKAHFRALAQKI